MWTADCKIISQMTYKWDQILVKAEDILTWELFPILSWKSNKMKIAKKKH